MLIEHRIRSRQNHLKWGPKGICHNRPPTHYDAQCNRCVSFICSLLRARPQLNWSPLNFKTDMSRHVSRQQVRVDHWPLGSGGLSIHCTVDASIEPTLRFDTHPSLCLVVACTLVCHTRQRSEVTREDTTEYWESCSGKTSDIDDVIATYAVWELPIGLLPVTILQFTCKLGHSLWDR